MTTHDVATRPVHTPRYLLRRRTILSALRRMPRGSFLEAGCGRGELLPWLGELGYWGVGLEISEDVLRMARQAARPLPRISIADSLDQVDETFDYLMAFEVLEHIEDDEGLLREWTAHLKVGGRFICTVPAHMKLWSSSDDAVGHVRRYERGDLLALLERTGLELEIIRMYGYPLILITGPLRSIYHRLRSRRWRDRTAEDKTLSSANDSTVPLPRPLAPLLGAAIGAASALFYYLGLPFRNTDRGSGYFVIARRTQ